MCALCQLIIDFRPQLDSSEKVSPYSRSLTQFVACLKYMQVIAGDLSTPLDPFLAGLREGERDLTTEAFVDGIRLILTPPCGEDFELTTAFEINALKQAKLKRLIANLSLLRQV